MTSWRKVIFGFVTAFTLSGCLSGLAIRHAVKTPEVKVFGKAPVEITGDAKAPSMVDTKQTESQLSIPEGSTFEFNEKLGILTLTLSKAANLGLSRSETAVKGPVAFTPDKAPSAQEVADAKADFWTVVGLRIAIVVGLFAAFFGLVRDYDFVMYGGAALAGAGLFGIFIQKHPVLVGIIAIGVTLIVVGPTLWHTKLKKLTHPNPNA